MTFNCAPGIVNGIEEEGKEFLKHSTLNEILLWILIVIATKTSEAIKNTFPGKQTIMKHDMNKFNLNQFECRIQSLTNLLVNGKSSMCFSSFCHSKYHKSVMLPLQCDFFCVLFLVDGYFKYLSFTSWHLRRMKSTLAIWHIAGKPYNWLTL